MDLNIKIIEKFYDLAEKLGIKIITIEEILEKEAEEAKKETKLGKLELYETDKRHQDPQHKDFIKLYFNEISKIPLLNSEEERDVAKRIKKGDENAFSFAAVAMGPENPYQHLTSNGELFRCKN